MEVNTFVGSGVILDGGVKAKVLVAVNAFVGVVVGVWLGVDVKVNVFVGTIVTVEVVDIGVAVVSPFIITRDALPILKLIGLFHASLFVYTEICVLPLSRKSSNPHVPLS